MIYFDNSATTKIEEDALNTYLTVSKQIYGNPSSLHELGERASRLLNQSRNQIANIIGVKNSEIHFTSGGTEGDNWAIKGTAFEKEPYGKHLITTKIEHPAVIESMKDLEKRGFEVTYLDVDESGHISLKQLKESIRPDTTLVSVMAVNNEIGAVQPIDEIGEILRDYPTIHFHVDCVQTVGKVEINLGKNSRVDIAVFSAHKFHGPRGVGFIYLKEGKMLSPLISGGGQESNQRSGTENLPAIGAMAKALRLLYENYEEKNQEIRAIKQYLRNYLEQKDKVRIFSPKEEAPHILCFGIEGIRGEVTVHAFEEHDIFLSTTSACSSRSNESSSTLLAMNVPKSLAETAVRVSLSYMNTMEEAETFTEKFDQIYQSFKVINS